MPELPEVETVRRGLSPVMLNQRIVHAQVRRAGLRWPFPPQMSARLTGRRVLHLRRRSKYILVDLDSDETLIIHLGMSGRMLVTPASGTPHPEPAKHDHVIFDIQGGARITFNDARRFGAMDLTPTDKVHTHRLLANLGPEPLGNSFDEPYLAARLKRRNTPIKSALLDQRVVAGLGNIYVSEILHRCGISPERAAGQISARHVRQLVPAIRDVLNEAIAAGGASLRDHRQTNGELGYFQHNFRVYGRENQPCAT
ncbi:MAG: bifunctional DNA-formamidopyrimidine glycosylase/DNA-(apurinic or apyrimidinic site) lyase, partial [Paracoccaceae bacterium]